MQLHAAGLSRGQPLLVSLLADVERCIAEALEIPSMALPATRDVARVGGKRARAMLSALSGLASGAPYENVVVYGSVAEVVHAATLVHDDVIDQGTERRGMPSPHMIVGNKRAILSGDALLTAGLRILSMRGLHQELQAMLSCMLLMVDGEYLQMSRQFQLPPNLELAQKVNRNKTSVLFGWCTSVGLIHRGASQEEIQRAAEIGISIGDTFQMIDDLLDLFGDAEVIGKPALQDLREGKVTPPVCRLLHEHPSLTTHLEAYWRALLRGEDERALLNPILQAAKEKNIDAEVRAAAQKRLEEGLSQISVFPVKQYADALQSLAESLLLRQK
jgi:geranylgeranyl pyrophosphate synthase